MQAARSRAAADGRDTAGVQDIVAVAPMALRLRYSRFIAEYVQARDQEDQAIRDATQALGLDGAEKVQP